MGNDALSPVKAVDEIAVGVVPEASDVVAQIPEVRLHLPREQAARAPAHLLLYPDVADLRRGHGDLRAAQVRALLEQAPVAQDVNLARIGELDCPKKRLRLSFAYSMSHDHDHGHSHGDLLSEFATELAPLLESTEQGVYIFFDDEHKVCNETFASLLGYGSAAEWAHMEGSFPEVFVDAGSHDVLIDAYRKAMEDIAASTIKIQWKKKSGGTADSTVMLVPISYQNHLFALHFVS